MNIPPSDPMDNNYARLVYVRYADDWLCGVIGSKEDCKKIKEDFKNFLKEQLQLELSEEKTLITNAQKSAKFLSYEPREIKQASSFVITRAELYWKFQVIQSGNT